MQTEPSRVLKTFTGTGEVIDRWGARRRVHYTLDVMERRRWSVSNGPIPPRGHGALWFPEDLYVGDPVDGLAVDAGLALRLAEGVSVDVKAERPKRSDLPWRFVVVGPVPVSP